MERKTIYGTISLVQSYEPGHGKNRDQEQQLD